MTSFYLKPVNLDLHIDKWCILKDEFCNESSLFICLFHFFWSKLYLWKSVCKNYNVVSEESIFEPKFKFINKITKYSSTAVRITKITARNRMIVSPI